MEREKIAVVPAGAFGTAMGIVAARNGHDVALYIPREETLRRVIDTGQNPKLAGIDLPESMMITGRLEEAMEGRSMVVFAAPSHVAKRFGEMMAKVANGTKRHVLSLTKGLHVTTSGDVMVYTDMLRSLNSHFSTAAESGPNFARVVAAGEERVRTVIASEGDLGYSYDVIFSTEAFLPELSTDEPGVQASGAAKNIIAFGLGICRGAGVSSEIIQKLVENQGPKEMAKLSALLGGREETANGIAGVEDLRLTSTMGSRNHLEGFNLGSKQKTPQQVVYEATNGKVVEGVHAAWAVKLLSEKHNEEFEVMGAVVDTLHNGLDTDEAVARMLKTVPGAA